MRRLSYPLLFLLLLIVVDTAHAWIVERVRNDFLALTRRVTARHILLPSEQVAVALKHKIRQKCLQQQQQQPNRNSYPFVVDVFARAAAKFGIDDTTNTRGGLLGELVPQGYCRDAVLDQACFQVKLGEIEGPIQSDYGYHLILVEERTNCPKLDGVNTKLVPCTKHGLGKLVPSRQEGQIDLEQLLRDQVLFWIGACLAGGIVAELSANLANSVT